MPDFASRYPRALCAGDVGINADIDASEPDDGNRCEADVRVRCLVARYVPMPQ